MNGVTQHGTGVSRRPPGWSPNARSRRILRAKGFWIGLGVIVVGLFALSILPPCSAAVRPKVGRGRARGPRQALAGTGLEVREVADVRRRGGAGPGRGGGGGGRAGHHRRSATGVRVSRWPTRRPRRGRVAHRAAGRPARPGRGRPGPAAARDHGVRHGVPACSGWAGRRSRRARSPRSRPGSWRSWCRRCRCGRCWPARSSGHSLLAFGQVAGDRGGRAGRRCGWAGSRSCWRWSAPAMGWFVPFLVLGFVLLAAMWAVAGSLVSRQEDLGSSMGR